MSTLNVPIKIKRGTGVPANGSLKRGELAYSEDLNKLYIGTGDEVGGFAPTVEELLTPATVLEDLANVSITSGPNDGDVLTYDDATGGWIAQAVAAATVAWADITGKPSVFTPDTHVHAWGDITSGVPSTFTPSAHQASHATGGSDALSPADIGAIPSSEKGANSGVATLDAGGKLETTQLPNLAITAFLGNAANEAAMLALTGQQGDWAIRDDTGAVWIITGSTPSSIGSWTQLSYPAAPVASVNGATGTVVLDHTDVGAAATSHTHSDATTGTAGFMSASDKTKLDGVASGATANTGTVTSVEGGTGLTGGTITGTGTLAVAYGTTAGTACEGNDARLSDSRTPTAHTHDVTDAYVGQIDTPTAKNYTIDLDVAAGRTVTALYFITASGTVDVTVKNGADTIYTADGLGTAKTSVTSGLSNATVSAGGTLTLTIDAVSTPSDLQFSIVYSRTTGAIS